jgi:hypothetical protein
VSLRFVVAGTLLAACGFRVSTGSGPGDTSDGSLGDATVTDAAIDAPPDVLIDARICPSPPAGCVGFMCAGSPSCYFVCNAEVEWTDARDRCSAAGACLATIDDAVEDACIRAATNPMFPDVVWFGFRQTGNIEPAGGWGWECGTSSYAAPNWGDFEPNNSGGNEDCGALGTGGAWLDGGCNSDSRFVCEIP